MQYYDVIIGGGITGCAAAYEFSKYDFKNGASGKENDVACGSTKANSAIIHAGYDPEPGTLMAKYNVRGNAWLTGWQKSWISPSVRRVRSTCLFGRGKYARCVSFMKTAWPTAYQWRSFPGRRVRRGGRTFQPGAVCVGRPRGGHQSVGICGGRPDRNGCHKRCGLLSFERREAPER